MTGYLRHIRRLNDFDARRFRPFVIDGVRTGWLRPAIAEALAAMPEFFEVESDRVAMRPHLATPQTRSAAMREVVERLLADGLIRATRGEMYAVANRFGDAPALIVDRGVVPYFGFKAYGVHVSGFVRRADGLALWIGRRAPDKKIEPNKLDNMIAGGQPHGLSLRENLIKEAWEEASVPRALAERAVPVGAVTYAMEVEGGSRHDCMFCYDLEVPDDFTPTPNDDEMTGFSLLPLAEALRYISETDEVKFNVNLVILDFAMRHGAFDPDAMPEFEALCAGMRGLRGA